MNTKKILICGGIQANFINRLTNGVKEFSNSKFSFDILYEHNINKKDYKNVRNFIEYKTNISFFKKNKLFFKLLFQNFSKKE